MNIDSNEKAIKEIEEKLQETDLDKYRIGELLYTAKTEYFPSETQFKDWIVDFRLKTTGLNNKYNEYDYEIKEQKDFIYSKVNELISYYIEESKKRKKFNEQRKILKDKEYQVTEEQLSEFLEQQELCCSSMGDLTDIEKEITLIGYLITSPETRTNYLPLLDSNFFNVKDMSKIAILLKSSDNESVDLSEVLIENGFTAETIKCISKIKENNKDKPDKIHSILSKYQILREYSGNTQQEDVKEFLNEVPTYSQFLKFSENELTNYLHTFLQFDEDIGYELISDYKTIPDSFSPDIEKFFNENDKTLTNTVNMPFTIINRCLYGFSLCQLLGIGMLSNCGKTRLLINMIVHLIFIENKKVFAIFNETTKQNFIMCLITSIINNPEIQKSYGFSINRTEREIRNLINCKDSELKKLLKKVKEKINTNLYIQTTDNYTDKDLKNMIVQEYYKNGTEYVFYDTLKVSSESTNTTDDLKRTATMLSELAKKYNLFIACTFQLTDETIKTAPKDIGRLNIANAKQIYHVMDSVLLFKEIKKEDFNKYSYIRYKENECNKLEQCNRYYLCSVDKNRLGEKPQLIFQVDLDLNTWEEKGILK